jgi:response regulator RpfG family c-di-GMP phosphodiesterase
MNTDLISLLFVGDEKNNARLDIFSKSNGFITHFYPLFRESGQESGEESVEKAAGMNPDIILIDKPSTMEREGLLSLEKWIRAFDKLSPGIKLPFFLAVDQYPEFESRMTLYGYGFDGFLVRPLSARELYLKSSVYLEKKTLEQKQITQKQSQDKSFHYLDKFSRELKSVKNLLISEKNSLNNALKQIHHMTKERSRMKKSLMQMKDSFGQNMAGFEQVLSTLITTRIEKNRGHGDRVAQISSFIAKELKFDEKKLEDLRKAAMLHEVGLLFMPDRGLEKEKKELTSYEKNIWLQFSVKGADLLNKCRGFEGAASMIRSLNENSDGTGYPEGLKKRLIPLASRILAGADEFDRLKDLPKIGCLEDLMAGLESKSGSRLDPVIVGWLEKYAVLHMGSDSYRVRGVGVEQLEPGMKLGCALFTNTGTKLFSVNTKLTRESIEKIIQYHREYPVDETVYIKA